LGAGLGRPAAWAGLEVASGAAGAYELVGPHAVRLRLAYCGSGPV